MNFTFTSNKSQVLAALKAAEERALEICGGTAEAHAKVNITRNHSVVTGNLRNSIAHGQLDDKTEAVGSNVEYAPYVELGTRKMHAKPYLVPAIEGHAGEYQRIIQQELSEIGS